MNRILKATPQIQKKPIIKNNQFYSSILTPSTINITSMHTNSIFKLKEMMLMKTKFSRHQMLQNSINYGFCNKNESNKQSEDQDKDKEEDIRVKAPRKKHSEWIFSTKHEEQQHRKPGSIAVYTHFGKDTHNCSLRLIQNIEKAHLILTNNPTNLHLYLQSIQKHQQFCTLDPSPSSNSSSSIPIPSPSPTSLQILLNPLTVPSTLQFDTEIEVSKMIQLEKQINKEAGEERNGLLEKEAKELRKYMQHKVLEENLKQIKTRQGYPAVVDLRETSIWESEGQELDDKNRLDQKKLTKLSKNMQKIKELKQKGFNIVIGFWEGEDNGGEIGEVLRQLEQFQVGYEILPCTDQMITAVVSSGFPADRFCVEMFPNIDENIEGIIRRRAKLKLTTCFQLMENSLPQLLKLMSKTLSPSHIIYLHSLKKPFRGEICNLEVTQLSPSQPQSICYLVMAPYIAQFNQKLTEQLNIQQHIQNELRSEKLNIVELEILNKKMEAMKKKQEVFQVDVAEMVAEMLVRIPDDTKVKDCLKVLWPKKKENQIDKLIKIGKERISGDYLGLADFQKGKWKQVDDS